MIDPTDRSDSGTRPATADGLPTPRDPHATAPYDPSAAEPATPGPGETTAEERSREPALPAPFRLGEYEVETVIKAGGMGTVYRARHARVGIVVALKQMHRELALLPDLRERFVREVRAQYRLDHPHVLKILEIRLEEPQPYYTMPLLPGGSLADRLRDYRDQRQAAALVEKIARGVGHAHEHGVLHRDLKPGNVLVDEHGEPLVSDFGLAKMAEDVEHLTQTGAVLGTLPYMAPEQAAGRSVGKPADVWALGVMLYELLAGRRPFEAPTKDALQRQILRDDPPSLGGLVPRVEPGLSAIIRTCLEKDPARRYADATALASDLGNWLRGEPIRARPDTRTRRLLRAARRHRRGVVAGLMLGAVALSLAVLVRSRDPNRPLRPLLADLEAGRPVTLVGETGEATWHQWAGPSGTLSKAESDGRDALAVQAWDPSFLELLPRVPADSYSLDAEVCHWGGGTKDGEVGVYAGHSQSSTFHLFWTLTFDDLGSKTAVAAPVDARDSLIDFELRSATKDESPRYSRQYITAVPFHATAVPKKQWRQLRIRVTPALVEAAWDGHPVFGVPAAERRKQWSGFLENLRIRDEVGGDFNSSGGLGLYVSKGAALFRNVSVRPLDRTGP